MDFGAETNLKLEHQISKFLCFRELIKNLDGSMEKDKLNLSKSYRHFYTIQLKYYVNIK